MVMVMVMDKSYLKYETSLGRRTFHSNTYVQRVCAGVYPCVCATCCKCLSINKNHCLLFCVLLFLAFLEGIFRLGVFTHPSLLGVYIILRSAFTSVCHIKGVVLLTLNLNKMDIYKDVVPCCQNIFLA